MDGSAGASVTAARARRTIERPALTLADRARRALRALKHAVTFWRRAVVLTVNRALGRTFVPRTNLMTIEPTGACNLACRFCGHPKKTEGKVSMPAADFAMVLDQVAATGTSYVSLTPTTGDVFMDKDILAKLAALQAHPGIDGFEFFTNFVLADAEAIAALAAAAKLKIMVISIYGHDEASFCAIADRPANQYARLVQNLRRLADAAPAFKGKIVVGLRTEEWVEWSPAAGWARHPGLAESDLLLAIRALCRHANVEWSGNYVGFDTWGGKVTPADVAGLDMTIRKRPNMPKIGAC
ncbi:MAG: radical SAM protein, partial [Alphaproteobacteria bacterium]|nr:radical SAM protein [Alphaproteobacteria bacterium]